MSTFSEANQVRLALKMKLSNYAWYGSSAVSIIDVGYGIIVEVTHVDNTIRRIIPPVSEGISVKTEIQN